MSELRLAVIGDPIAHTLSPLIQGKMMERLGAEGDYRAVHVTEEELPSFVEMAALTSPSPIRVGSYPIWTG